MRLAIIILNWNGAQLLKDYLPSVLLHSADAAVYVIDNASTDNSLDVLNQSFPEVVVIQNEENYGFAGGYNKGLEKIDADLFCLLNSDVAVTPNWTTPLIQLFKEKPEVAIAQPKILNLRNPAYFEYAGAGGGFIDKLGYPYCRGRIFQAIEKDEGQYNDIHEVFWATGACMFIRKDCFLELNGFDADYFAHQEEIDLCWRAKNVGHKVYYVGTSSVYHLGGFTLKNSNPNKTFLNFRNSLYSITKNLPPTVALGIIGSRLILDGIAAIHFAIQLKFRHSFAILRAHLSFYSNLSKMCKKREKSNYLLKYYTVKSIVWAHFVNGVKNFNILVKD